MSSAGHLPLSQMGSWQLPAPATCVCSWQDEKIAIGFASDTARVAIFDSSHAQVVIAAAQLAKDIPATFLCSRHAFLTRKMQRR